jgi:flagellar basal-body rod protein FlgF/flagellar basal-body rod protein FlgG
MSAEGAQVQQQRLQVIANNLANMETAGFKRDVPMFQARFAEAIQQGLDYPHSRTQNDIGGGVKLMGVETDFASSSLRETNMPTDFAVNGDGFFQVRGKDNEVFLTRAGNFMLDAQGRLVTQTGNMPVLSESGNEIVLNPSTAWEVYPGGNISQDGNLISLGLVRPQSLGNLVKVGDNMFRSLGPAAPVDEGACDVRQGYLEQSGVNPTREMMEMISTSRAFEANTRLIQHHDSMISGLVNRVLAVHNG